MARTMLNAINIPKHFWVEAINTTCYIINRVLLRPNLGQTSYQLWKCRKPNVSYFHALDVFFYIEW